MIRVFIPTSYFTDDLFSLVIINYSHVFDVSAEPASADPKSQRMPAAREPSPTSAAAATEAALASTAPRVAAIRTAAADACVLGSSARGAASPTRAAWSGSTTMTKPSDAAMTQRAHAEPDSTQPPPEGKAAKVAGDTAEDEATAGEVAPPAPAVPVAMEAAAVPAVEVEVRGHGSTDVAALSGEVAAIKSDCESEDEGHGESQDESEAESDDSEAELHQVLTAAWAGENGARTGRAEYLAACHVEGAAPSGGLIARLECAVVSLRHRGLGPRGVQALAAMLPHNDAIRSLDLSDNMIDSDALARLADGLSRNESVMILDLGSNRAIGAGGINALCDRLGSMPLRELGLRENALGDRAAAALCTSLRANRNLLRLDLARNRRDRSKITRRDRAPRICESNTGSGRRRARFSANYSAKSPRIARASRCSISDGTRYALRAASRCSGGSGRLGE